MSPRGKKQNAVLKADVVVIGGGGAGMPAALTAVEEGAKSVIVVEKRFATGGDALRANWIMAVESPLQKKAGVTLTRDGMFRQAMEWHHYDRINPKILRALINGTSETVQWLMDEGVAFELRAMGDPKTASSHWVKGSPAPDSLCTFSSVFRLLQRKCEEAGIQFLVRASVKKIMRGSRGNVTGVLIKRRNGQEIEIKTKSAILCTGSFNGNKTLLKKYFPQYWDDIYHTDALLSNKGEGIPVAEEAGAALEGYCCLIRHAYAGVTEINNRCHELGNPAGIRVNKLGQRFIAENIRETSANVMLQQPGKIAYTLYDDKIVQSLVDENRPVQWARVAPPPDKIPDLRQYLQKMAKTADWVKISRTWNGIAKWIGCDPKVLKATMEQYNAFCDKGYDDDFAKEEQFLVPLRTAPFYGFLIRPLMIESVGPVRVNEGFEVLDKKNRAIPGFYAAGVITSGWESNDYGGTPGGTALGFSMTSGRIAATNAVKYTLGK